MVNRLSVFCFSAGGDISKIRYFIDQISDEKERSIAWEKLNQMLGLASHNVCRRKQLLKLFGEEYALDNCRTCDICSGGKETIDITVEAQIFMSAILRTGQRFGIGHLVDIVIGAGTRRIRELRHDQIKTYGAGKHRDKKYWQALVDELLAQEVIRPEDDRYPVLKVTPKGSDVLHGKIQLTALEREQAKVPEQIVGIEKHDHILFEKLRAVRRKFAEVQGVPPFVIFSDKTLHEMSRYYPDSLNKRRKINGVGEVKLERYAEAFLLEIKKYLQENPHILANGTPTAESNQFGPKLRQEKKIGETVEDTYAFFEKGLSMEEIAGFRRLTIAPIIEHVERLLQAGRAMDIDRLVDPVKRDIIEKLFLASQQWKLTPVVEQSEGTISYEEARLVRAFLIGQTKSRS